MEKVYVSAEWCWLLLEIEDENNSFLGDGLNITLLRKGAASSVGKEILVERICYWFFLFFNCTK